MLQFIMSRTIRIHRWECCFNTSHVVVYLVVVRSAFCLSWFQYISCCSLSRSKHLYLSLIKVSIHLMLQFIELSCVSVWCRRSVSIHLMLQFILTTGFSTVADGSFNTSHVVVYQISPTIHNIIIQLFQYISCCSLSRISINKGFLFLCFNTSHVVVYLGRTCQTKSDNAVSIHLMLQFILVL